MKFRSRLVMGIVGGAWLAACPWAARGAGPEDTLAVVVNKSNTIENITQAQLCKLLMGEASWSSGKPVSALLRSSGPEREAVLKAVCAMTSIQFMQTLVKSGGSVPKSLATEAAVKQLVITLPGAIGFLHVDEVTSAVRVVKLDGAAPGDSGYKLKLN